MGRGGAKDCVTIGRGTYIPMGGAVLRCDRSLNIYTNGGRGAEAYLPDIFFGWRMEEAEVEMEMVVEREVSLCIVFVNYVLSFSISFFNFRY